jgi:hypothetical protein
MSKDFVDFNRYLIIIVYRYAHGSNRTVTSIQVFGMKVNCRDIFIIRILSCNTPPERSAPSYCDYVYGAEGSIFVNPVFPRCP